VRGSTHNRTKVLATNELPPLLKAAKYEGLMILPVLVGAYNFEYTDLEQFQVVNDHSKPLSAMRKPVREVEWANIAKIVLETLGTQKSERAEDLVFNGKRLNIQGNYREVATILHQAWLMKPDSFDAWLEYGYALDKLVHHREAINAFEHAIFLDPNRFMTSRNSSRGRSVLSSSKHVSIFCGSGSVIYNHGLGTNASKRISYDSVGSTSVHVITSTAQAFLGLAIKRSLPH
jgi:tetratricopeptide (TPR) repeat protein